jgi:hypothetical protein
VRDVAQQRYFIHLRFGLNGDTTMFQRKLSVLLFVTATACGQSHSPSKESVDDAAEPATEAAYASFETYWQTRSVAETAERAHAVAEILANHSLPTAPFLEAAEKHSGEAGAWVSMNLENINVTYYPEQDDLRVSNPDLRKETEQDATDQELEPEAARDVFLSTVGSLVDRRLIDARQYDTSKVKVATTVFSAGEVGVSQPAKEVVTEHNFTLMRQLNGIDFANAGVKVAVRRTGEVAEIRIGGAGIKSQFRPVNETTKGLRLRAVTSGEASSDLVETPTGAGQIFRGTLDATKFLNDFAKRVPQGNVEWSKPMYMLPMGKLAQAGVLEPRYVVSYSEVHGEAVSRRKYIGYSVRDGGATDLSEISDPGAAGDRRSD